MVYNLQTIVGLVASGLTALSLTPQLVKLLKDKKADGISLAMLIIMFAELAAWIYYGMIKEDWIIIISNSISFILNGIIVAFTLKYKN